MKIVTWLTDSLHRMQPHTPPQTGASAKRFAWEAARGEWFSCQVGIRLEGDAQVSNVQVSAKADSGLSIRIRRVGYVPVPHHNTGMPAGHVEGTLPGYVGDPLFDEDAVKLWPGETHAFWLTVQVSPRCRAGLRKAAITVSVGGVPIRSHELSVRVHDVTIRPRRGFPVVQWFYCDALLDFYKLTAFEPAFWPIAEKYIRDVVSHGQDSIYVPMFTPPLDGVKRPTQLVKVRAAGRGKYKFDFADARKWIRMARRVGIRHFEINHLFTQWGVKHAIRIYHGQGLDERLLWPADTPATGPVYRNFLTQYLPKLRAFLQAEGILDRCFFHISDEPHGDEHRANYAAARKMISELAPWIKTMDALSEVVYAREGLVDTPIPSIQTVMSFLSPGPNGEPPVPCWTYYCCGPRGKFLNRLVDSPLAKIRMNGWLFYRTGVKGFLHWGYNYWYKSQTRQMIDPFTVSDGGWAPGWAYGDTFVVYPGPEGPIDSIRWEVFAESLQDFALLQTLGVDRNAKLLAALRDYQDFPFSRQWIVTARHKLFAGR